MKMRSFAKVIHSRFLQVSMLAVGMTLLLFASVLFWENWGWREKIEKETIENHRDHLRELVMMGNRYVNGEIEATEERLRKELMSQMDLAWSLLEHVDNGKRGFSKKERIHAIVEALRPLRFHGKSGYFFMTGYDGVELLFPPNPKLLEGVSLAKQPFEVKAVIIAHDSIVKKSGSGFHKYLWSRPGYQGFDHQKISYVRGHDELGFVLGTGMYIDEIIPSIQKEVVNQLAKMNAGDDAYFFATNWEGVVQLGPAAGKNMIHVKDVHGIPIVRRMIELSKHGGGFLEYHMPAEVGDATVHKMSYVVGIPQWGWYLGVGRNVRQLEASIQEKQKEMRRQFLGIVFVSLLAALLLVFFVAFITRHIARKFGRDLKVFLDYFREAGRTLKRLPEEKVEYLEFLALAKEANAMVLELQQASEEKARTAEMLEIKNRELEQILFISGHDLRTPLVTLQGFTSELGRACEELKTIQKEGQILEREKWKEISEETIPEANKFIQSATKRMEVLLGGVLRYGRMSRIQPEPAVLDVGTICRECLESMGMQESSSMASVQIEDIPACFADPALVMQIVGNLLENSMKYKAKDRALVLQIFGKQKEQKVAIHFKDNGMGISSSHLPKVFGLFSRFHKDSNIPGDGLGLSLSRGLAIKMGGNLWVESVEGNGCTFILELPAKF